MTRKVLLFFIFFISVPLCAPGVLFCEETSQEVELFDYANGLFSRGMYEMSVNEYRKFLEKYPESEYSDLAAYRIAEAYFIKKQYDRALESLNSYLQEYPQGEKADRAALRKAQIYFFREDHAAAADLLKELYQKAEKQTIIPAGYYLSRVYSAQGRSARAIEVLQELAAEADTDNMYFSFIHMSLGDLLLETDRSLEAARSYEKAAGSSEKDAAADQAELRAAGAYRKAGDTEKAISVYEKLVRTAPEGTVRDNSILGLLWSLFREGRFEQVINRADKLSSSIQSKEAAAQAAYLKGNASFEMGQYREAFTAYSNCWQKHPRTRDGKNSAVNMLWSLYRAGEHDRCLRKADKLLDEQLLADMTAEITFVKARAQEALGHIDKALELYGVVIDDHSGSVLYKDAMFNSAFLLSRSGDHEKAVNRFQQFISAFPVGPAAPRAYLGLGKEFADAGKYNKAEKTFKAFLDKFSQNPLRENVLYHLARTYFSAGKYEQAEAAADRFLSEYPGSNAIRSARLLKGSILQSTGRQEKAIELYSEVVAPDARDDYSLKALESMAYAYYQQERQREAAGTYHRIVTSFPNAVLNPSVYEWVSEYFLYHGEYEKSLEVLDRYTDKYPDREQGKITFMYGKNYMEMGYLEKARQYLDRATGEATPSPYLERAYLLLARIHSEKGDTGRAMELINRALKTQEDTSTAARARMYRGTILAEQGMHEQAGREYMMVAILYEDAQIVPEALYRAGNAFNRGGNVQKADEAFRELINSYPQSEYASRALKRVNGDK